MENWLIFQYKKLSVIIQGRTERKKPIPPTNMARLSIEIVMSGKPLNMFNSGTNTKVGGFCFQENSRGELNFLPYRKPTLVGW